MPQVIGLVGLAVMGENLALNIERNGFPVAVYNRTFDKTEKFLNGRAKGKSFVGTKTIPEFVASLARPRRIVTMVKAGKPVDDVVGELRPHLERGDVVVDGGNSHFADTRRRADALSARGVHFLGVGISGGEDGALHGPSIMPGGPRDAYLQVEDVLTRISADVDGTPCCTYVGPDGAGHYVKMVHNGIEYADIQLIAEAYDLLRRGAGLDAEQAQEAFERWDHGDLDSFLIESTARVLSRRDAATGRPMVDVIVDEAEQKGTGRWTAQEALELGVPLTAITEAVYARSLSARRDQRRLASAVLAGPTPGGRRTANASFVDDVERALYASKIVAYAQGFEQLTAASTHYGWKLDLGSLATIWRGGCIIRAAFLDRIREAYAQQPEQGNLLLIPYFHDEVGAAQDAWRRVVISAVDLGVPVPAFSAALAYYDGLRSERGPASLIQALRDLFGAHTYHRTDREGNYHTRWLEDGAEVRTDG